MELKIEEWMIDLANKQINKPFTINVSSASIANRVFAEREYVMGRLPQVPRGFAVLVAPEAELHFIASPNLNMQRRGEEQLFFTSLRSIVLCHSLGMEFEPITTLFLMTSINSNDFVFSNP